MERWVGHFGPVCGLPPGLAGCALPGESVGREVLEILQGSSHYRHEMLSPPNPASVKRESKSGYADGNRNSPSTVPLRHPTPKRASANERAINQGGGGHPPATLCVRAFSRESLDPRPGPGGKPRCRCQPALVPAELSIDDTDGPPGPPGRGHLSHRERGMRDAIIRQPFRHPPGPPGRGRGGHGGPGPAVRRPPVCGGRGPAPGQLPDLCPGPGRGHAPGVHASLRRQGPVL